jgi:serine/threonine protein kinase
MENQDFKNISLGTRYRFALELAECVFFLHLTGWLHKGINSFNILISGLQANKSNTSTSKSPPSGGRLSLVGFRTSRLDKPDEKSEKFHQSPHASLYIHPDYQSEGQNHTYSRIYDIYSLGVCLLELAFWQPIWVYGEYKPKKHTLKSFAKKLQTESTLNTLEFSVGSPYRRAVEWCLKSKVNNSQGGTDQSKKIEQASEFWEKVVVELAKCSISE